MGATYDNDILVWSEQQGDLLRRLARGERVNDALDFDNLVEEVESVGRSELQAVESLLDVGLTHLLQAYGSTLHDPVPHWRIEARAALARAARKATPSMQARLDLADIWSLARQTAADKLAVMQATGLPLPMACPFSVAELLNRDPDNDPLLARLATA